MPWLHALDQYATTLSTALDLQEHRLFASADEPHDTQADFWFAAVAIRNVQRLGKLAAEHLNDERLKTALSVFEEAVVYAAARDSLEHFDKYLRGEGNLQKKAKGRAPSEDFLILMRQEYLNGLERIRFQVGHRELVLPDDFEPARNLLAEVMRAARRQSTDP